METTFFPIWIPRPFPRKLYACGARGRNDEHAGRYNAAIPHMDSLNEVYSSLSARRRYEAWFVRLGLADGAGAWWLRYLLSNPGRAGCAGDVRVDPVQIWATWFPRGGMPRNYIQGFARDNLQLSAPGTSPFHFRIGDNSMDEDSCRGELAVEGHRISWDLRYASDFRVTLSSKGWIGFSRSPHSTAPRFSPGRSAWTATGLQQIRWVLACKATTAGTGTGDIGGGRMLTSAAAAGGPARWRHWCTTCLSGWCFARQCSGMAAAHTSSAT
jgi:hypothetical protein